MTTQVAEIPKVQIEEYSRTAAALAELRHRYKNLVVDVKTKQGMETAIAGRAELRTYYVDLEKMRVKLKAPALERSRLIDAEAKMLDAELRALHDPIDDMIKAEQTRKEREKAEREEAERKRIADIQERILAIAAAPAAMVGKHSEEIRGGIELLQSETSAPWAQEFQVGAEDTIARTIAALQQLNAGAVAKEEADAREAARIQAEREELARLRAEREARERDEKAALEQREREETERRARQEAEERAARERIEAEQRASREKIEAEEKAAKAARDEEDRRAAAAREAEEARARAEQAEKTRLEQQEREARDVEEKRVAKAQAEEAARLRAESERLDAEKREVARQQAELDDGETILRKFVERFGKRREFAAVVKAIKAHLEAK